MIYNLNTEYSYAFICFAKHIFSFALVLNKYFIYAKFSPRGPSTISSIKVQFGQKSWNSRDPKISQYESGCDAYMHVWHKLLITIILRG